MEHTFCPLCVASDLAVYNISHGFIGAFFALFSIPCLFLPRNSDSFPDTLFISLFMIFGLIMFGISTLGHVALKSLKSGRLFCYTALLCLLVAFEVMAAGVVTTNNSGQGFPGDRTGKLEKLIKIIKDNDYVFYLYSTVIFLMQLICLVSSVIVHKLVVTTPQTGWICEKDHPFYGEQAGLPYTHAQNP